MYEPKVPEDILFFMFYGGVTMLAILASCYLLFRRGNAFARDITPPLRLRRWAALCLASVALSHLWYLPVAFLTSPEAIRMSYYVGWLLDVMVLIPLMMAVQLVMLQDRRRALWPVAVAVVPVVALVVVYTISGSYDLLPLLQACLVLIAIGFMIYMVRGVRQYGRWLRDNYADLEHKEVWHSLLVLTAVMLLFAIYFTGFGGSAFVYIIQAADIVFIGYLLWRVETLSDLSVQSPPMEALEPDGAAAGAELVGAGDSPAATHSALGELLQQKCIDTQLYLQHDLSLPQLAKAIGTNRLYLSQYFAAQGTTYNAYINDLRISHFVSLYRQSHAAQQAFTLKQLAAASGYCSYSTFALAFRQRMGLSVTAWTRQTAGKKEPRDLQN